MNRLIKEQWSSRYAILQQMSSMHPELFNSRNACVWIGLSDSYRSPQIRLRVSKYGRLLTRSGGTEGSSTQIRS